MEQNFEFRILLLCRIFWNSQKSVARSLCVDLDHYGRAQTRSH